MKSVFEDEYKKLNKAQKEAVDTIEGPVMVIAGPGTGKTQILALRIANILKETDTKGDGVLCLTFTNSAVRAMRERLHKYIGNDAARVGVFTFHKFSASIIEQFYSAIGLLLAPRVLEDAESVSICDQILRENEWQHIRPRGDVGRYFKELKSLVSLLKRERLSPTQFLEEIEKEITEIKKNPDSISTRGESKGKMKKEILGKIESLERTKEIVVFYELYERVKKEMNLMDHDDTIKYALEIAEASEEARAEIREKYLYVLIDEHQDSSGTQNDLLKAIWQDEQVEKPNIFAVGDDRQLIYAFGGAKMSHFEEFKTMFGKTKVIFLTDNYRSTQNILDTADALLSSAFSEEKLKAMLKENHELNLVECDYPRDEILACGLKIKDKLKNKEIEANDCAILVPKNRQVVSAIRVLKDLGLNVAAKQSLSLFEAPEADTLLRVLKICANSSDAVALAETILDPIVGIPVLEAHEYLYEKKGKDLGLSDMLKAENDLFGKNIGIKTWADTLRSLVSISTEIDVYGLVQRIGDEVLIKKARDHTELVHRVEVIRSFLHLALSFSENPTSPRFRRAGKEDSLTDFISFIDRTLEYGEDVPLSVFRSDEGVKVMTLHGSKGLEFDFVWIAHLDEGSLMRGKRRNFRLPENVAEKIEEKDELAAKRELYVAITRAKRFCALSYSRFSYSGQNQELSKIVADLSAEGNMFRKSSFDDTEAKILKIDPKIYISKNNEPNGQLDVLKDLAERVALEYADTNVSVSLLNNFFECSRKWYFRNLLRLPEPKSESLEFGTRVHDAIDQVLKSRGTPTEKEIEKMSQGDKTAARIISRWVRKRLPEISMERENEKSISARDQEFPHLNIYGKLDLIERLADGLRVTDFKTGNPRKKSDIEKLDEEGRMSDYLRQLAMYSYLLRESRKEKVTESRLEFLEAKNEKDSFYDTRIGDKEIALLLKDVKDYDELVRGGGWIDRPCHFKTYGKAGATCQYCSLFDKFRV